MRQRCSDAMLLPPLIAPRHYFAAIDIDIDIAFEFRLYYRFFAYAYYSFRYYPPSFDIFADYCPLSLIALLSIDYSSSSSASRLISPLRFRRLSILLIRFRCLMSPAH